MQTPRYQDYLNSIRSDCFSWHHLHNLLGDLPNELPLGASFGVRKSLRVQVPNNQILTQNLDYNNYYPKPKYAIIGYLDAFGKGQEDWNNIGVYCRFEV